MVFNGPKTYFKFTTHSLLSPKITFKMKLLNSVYIDSRIILAETLKSPCMMRIDIHRHVTSSTWMR
jgi:hypothetical protein